MFLIKIQGQVYFLGSMIYKFFKEKIKNKFKLEY
jgi:hypothetical protein